MRELQTRLYESKYPEVEDVSSSYCRMMMAKMSHRPIVLAYIEKYKKEYDATRNYMHRLGIKADKEVELKGLSELWKLNAYKDSVVLLVRTFGSRTRGAVYKFLDDFTFISPVVLPYPDLINGYISEIFIRENIDRLERVYELFSDDESKSTFVEILRAYRDGDFYRRDVHSQTDKYFECYEKRTDEHLVNCGSATGDTIVKYVMNGYPFEAIYAFEGDKKQFKKLNKNLRMLDKGIRDRIYTYNKFIGTDSSEDKFDVLFNNKKVTLINMDIEGAEMAVLGGAKRIIHDQRPVLAICAYHRLVDLYEIPEFVQSTCDEYVFYLRKYAAAHPGELGEFVYYCVPKERIIHKQDLGRT